MKLNVYITGGEEPFTFYDDNAIPAQNNIEYALSRDAMTTIPCKHGKSTIIFVTKNIAAYVLIPEQTAIKEDLKMKVWAVFSI